MNGITIVAISEEQGKAILALLTNIDATLTDILARVERIPGPASQVQIKLGKVQNQ